MSEYIKMRMQIWSENKKRGIADALDVFDEGLCDSVGLPLEYRGHLERALQLNLSLRERLEILCERSKP